MESLGANMSNVNENMKLENELHRVIDVKLAYLEDQLNVEKYSRKYFNIFVVLIIVSVVLFAIHKKYWRRRYANNDRFSCTKLSNHRLEVVTQDDWTQY